MQHMVFNTHVLTSR